MSKLHKILARHFSPKDSIDCVFLYVVADSERTVFDKLDSPCIGNAGRIFTFGAWSERDESGEVLDVYDSSYNIVGQETNVQKMMRIRGDYNDQDFDTSDAYYGVTAWGWDEGVDITEEDAQALFRLGLAEDWRQS